MKRKPAKTKPAKPKAGQPEKALLRSPKRAAAAQQKAAPRQQPDVDAMVAACAQALGLAIEPAWQDSVKFNLRLVLRHAALIDEFPLPDETEPAPIFHA
jgi:Protein of unknown function (DUF4089)